MIELSMLDMNSLNAIAGCLRCNGQEGMANVLLSIQEKAATMILKCGSEEARCGLPKDSKCN